MSERRFSRMGDPPTQFETELLCVADQSDPWVLIGQRIGIHALFVLLDEIGGEKVNVPQRENFQRRLFRPVRDTEIRALKEHYGFTNAEIAERTGLSRQSVGVILSHPGASIDEQ